MSNVIDIVQELKAARLAAGLTQRDVAELMGVTQPAIAKIEASNAETASFNQITQYARALGMSLDVSITGAPNTLSIRTEPFTRNHINPDAKHSWVGDNIPTALTFPVGGKPSWLAINGPSGSGKTVALARVVEQLAPTANVFVIDSDGYLATLLNERDLDCTILNPCGPLDAEAEYRVALARLSDRPLVLVQDTTPNAAPAHAFLAAIGDRGLDLMVSSSYQCVGGRFKPSVVIETRGGHPQESWELSLTYPSGGISPEEVVELSQGAPGECRAQKVSVNPPGSAVLMQSLRSAPAGGPVYILDPSRLRSLPTDIARLVTLRNVWYELSRFNEVDKSATAEVRELLAATDLTNLNRAAATARALAVHYPDTVDLDRLAEVMERLAQDPDGHIDEKTPYAIYSSVYRAIADNIQKFRGARLIIRQDFDWEPHKEDVLRMGARELGIPLIFIVEGGVGLR